MYDVLLSLAELARSPSEHTESTLELWSLLGLITILYGEKRDGLRPREAG